MWLIDNQPILKWITIQSNPIILSFSSERLQDFITNIAVAHERGSIIDFADLIY